MSDIELSDYEAFRAERLLREKAEAEVAQLRAALSSGEAGLLAAKREAEEWWKRDRARAEAAEAEVGRLTEQDGAMLRNTMEALHAAEAEVARLTKEIEP